MSNIDDRKSALLSEFMELSSGASSDDILPLLLAFSNKAKQEHISFTKSDIETLFESMKKDMNPEEQSKINRTEALYHAALFGNNIYDSSRNIDFFYYVLAVYRFRNSRNFFCFGNYGL